MRIWLTIVVVCAGAGVARAPVNAQLPFPSGQIHHARGQNVAPVYEGWYEEPDGTVKLSFGYLNKNYEEAIDIPVGPNNRIEPGSPDNGQPTHFLPRRQFGVFAVTLPKDAPKTEFTWTLTIRGRSESVPATLNPLYIIGALKQIGGTADGITPPFLKLSEAAAPAAGPGGTSIVLQTPVSAPLAIDAWVSNQGARAAGAPLPVPPARREAPLRVTWTKYRGPGPVQLSEPSPPVQEGKARVVATFTEPGEYILRAVAFRGNAVGGQCCWTNGYARVTVEAPGRAEGAGPARR
jgi:hypothetical protein